MIVIINTTSVPLHPVPCQQSPHTILSGSAKPSDSKNNNDSSSVTLAISSSRVFWHRIFSPQHSDVSFVCFLSYKNFGTKRNPSNRKTIKKTIPQWTYRVVFGISLDKSDTGIPEYRNNDRRMLFWVDDRCAIFIVITSHHTYRSP